MAREYEADYTGTRPRLKRRPSNLKKSRWTYGAIIVLIVVGVAAWVGWPYFEEYAPDSAKWLRSTYDSVVDSAKGLWKELDDIGGLLPETRDNQYMHCYTARLCATVIKNDYQAELDAGAADFYAVRASGTVVTVEYRFDTVRADYDNGMVEDGRTLDE
jgi:hypothetical protein